MELYFRSWHDASVVAHWQPCVSNAGAEGRRWEAAMRKNQAAEQPVQAGLSSRGWPSRSLASVALLLAAACASEEAPSMDDGNAAPTEQPSENENEGEGEDPSATETNFFEIACEEDADCSDGRTCRLPADAGAVVPLGRCVPPADG
jgi:hypothetical protein